MNMPATMAAGVGELRARAGPREEARRRPEHSEEMGPGAGRLQSAQFEGAGSRPRCLRRQAPWLCAIPGCGTCGPPTCPREPPARPPFRTPRPAP